MNIGIDVSDEAIRTFTQYKLGKLNASYLIFNLSNEIEIDSIGEKGSTFEAFSQHMMQLGKNGEDVCRYGVKTVKYTNANGELRSKTVLVLYSPMSASVKSRMLHASCLGTVKTSLEGIQCVYQTGCVDEDEIIAKCKTLY